MNLQSHTRLQILKIKFRKRHLRNLHWEFIFIKIKIFSECNQYMHVQISNTALNFIFGHVSRNQFKVIFFYFYIKKNQICNNKYSLAYGQFCFYHKLKFKFELIAFLIIKNRLHWGVGISVLNAIPNQYKTRKVKKHWRTIVIIR